MILNFSLFAGYLQRSPNNSTVINSRFWLKATFYEKLPSMCLLTLSWSETSIILPHSAFILLNKFVSKMIATVSVEFTSQNVCYLNQRRYSKAGLLVLVLKNLYLKSEICQVLSSLALAL